MASMISYGHKVLAIGSRCCALPGCDCKPDLELMRTKANNKLDASHKLDEATFKAIWQDLDQHLASDRPAIGAGNEKQRDDGDFERAVEEAFKVSPPQHNIPTLPRPVFSCGVSDYLDRSNEFWVQAFRDQEREIILNAPASYEEAPSCSNESTGGKWWFGAAHLRHYVEFLLVLKGYKPCLLFHKYAFDFGPIFSTVIIDCLVPIMDRLDLWSYGFGLSLQTGNWVFYDARSPLMPLVDKIWLTHHTIKEKYPAAYPPLTDHRQVAQTLGYPVPFDDFPSGRWICIFDTTEKDVLVSMGWSEPCRGVEATTFGCPVGGFDEWGKVFCYSDMCELEARSVGTVLELDTSCYPEMTSFLAAMHEALDFGDKLEATLGRQRQDKNESLSSSESKVDRILEKLERLMETLDEISSDGGLDQQDESVEDSGDQC